LRLATGFQSSEVTHVRNKVAEQMPNEFDLQREIDHLLSSECTPQGLVTTNNFEIINFFGHTGHLLGALSVTA
jgi:hypothetical protein